MAANDVWYAPFMVAMGLNTKAFDLDSDTLKFQLLTNTYTPAHNTDDEEADLAADHGSTGDYVAGGVAVVAPAWSLNSTDYVMLDFNDISLANTTLVNVRQMPVFDDTLAGDPLITDRNFAADFNTSAGTFQVGLAATGFSRFKMIV